MKKKNPRQATELGWETEELISFFGNLVGFAAVILAVGGLTELATRVFGEWGQLTLFLLFPGVLVPSFVGAVAEDFASLIAARFGRSDE